MLNGFVQCLSTQLLSLVVTKGLLTLFLKLIRLIVHRMELCNELCVVGKVMLLFHQPRLHLLHTRWRLQLFFFVKFKLMLMQSEYNYIVRKQINSDSSLSE